MKKSQRRKFFVDSHVQGAIIVRVILYWASCVLFIAVPQIIVRTFFEPSRPFWQQFSVLWSLYWPVISATIVLVPFFIFDAIRMSNRFAGPIFKLRREMKRLAAGETVDPIRFRDGDFWRDLAIPFNQIAERLDSLDNSRGNDDLAEQAIEELSVDTVMEEQVPVGAGATEE